MTFTPTVLLDKYLDAYELNFQKVWIFTNVENIH